MRERHTLRLYFTTAVFYQRSRSRASIDCARCAKHFPNRHTTPSSVTDSSTEKSPFSIVATTNGGATEDEVATVEPSTLNSSLMIMVFTFVVVFILINVTVVSLYVYHKRQNMKEKEKSLKRRFSEKRDDSAKRSKVDKHENCGQIGYKSDSKPDLNDVIKNDKAYDNNSNFGRRSKLSRQNSSSTIDTHIKVREWIQQEIVHRSVKFCTMFDVMS